MRITWTITADCDPEPDEDVIQTRGPELNDRLSVTVADVLADAGAGFEITVYARREP